MRIVSLTFLCTRVSSSSTSIAPGQTRNSTIVLKIAHEFLGTGRRIIRRDGGGGGGGQVPLLAERFCSNDDDDGGVKRELAETVAVVTLN